MIKINYKISGFVVLFIIAVVVLSCKEVTIVLPSPSITLNSVKQISFKSFEIEIGFNPGEGQVLKNIELELENLTILNSPLVTERIEITDLSGSTVIKHTFNAEQINHDFKIKAILNTDKYQYQSQTIVYHSLKNNFYFNIEKDPAYYSETGGGFFRTIHSVVKTGQNNYLLNIYDDRGFAIAEMSDAGEIIGYKRVTGYPNSRHFSIRSDGKYVSLTDYGVIVFNPDGYVE